MNMSILCFIQGHSPSEERIWNRGYSFSKCRRCSCDMIRSDCDWTVVPRGHRVVWKNGLHEHSRPAGYVRNLPILYRDAVRGGVPAHWQSGGWYGRLLALAGGGAAERLSPPQGAAAAAVALDAPDDSTRPFPYLIALAAVAGAGIQILLAERSGRSL
jgi:hypothetical protein